MKSNFKKSFFPLPAKVFLYFALLWFVLLPLKVFCEESDLFQYLPKDGAFPEEGSPMWRKAGTLSATIEDDKLRVELKDNQILFWMLGTKLEDELGEAKAWDLNKTGDGTVTFQLKCHSDTADANIFTFMVTGKLGMVWLNFYNDHIQFGPSENQSITHDCENEDVYRIAVSNGKFSLFSKREGVLVDQVELRGTTDWNLLWFGSTYPFGEKPDEDRTCLRQWELGFIKWTNRTALFEAPTKE